MTDMVLGELDSSTSNVDLIIEVGPHTALGGPIQQILALPEFEELQIPYFGCLVRKTNAADSMQTLAAGLLQEGYDVKIEAVNFPHGKRSHVKVLTELPSYPWNHQIKIQQSYSGTVCAAARPLGLAGRGLESHYTIMETHSPYL
jgi:hypothetical protein